MVLYDNAVYFDIGDAGFVCRFCKVLMWYEERAAKQGNTSNLEFSMCCMQGRIEIAPFGRLQAQVVNQSSHNCISTNDVCKVIYQNFIL